MLQYLISCCFFIVFSTVHVLSLSFKNDNFFIINYYFCFCCRPTVQEDGGDIVFVVSRST